MRAILALVMIVVAGSVLVPTVVRAMTAEAPQTVCGGVICVAMK